MRDTKDEHRELGDKIGDEVPSLPLVFTFNEARRAAHSNSALSSVASPPADLLSPPRGWPEAFTSGGAVARFIGSDGLHGVRCRTVCALPEGVAAAVAAAGVWVDPSDSFGNALRVRSALGWRVVKGFAVFESAEEEGQFVAVQRWWNGVEAVADVVAEPTETAGDAGGGGNGDAGGGGNGGWGGRDGGAGGDGQHVHGEGGGAGVGGGSGGGDGGKDREGGGGGGMNGFWGQESEAEGERDGGVRIATTRDDDSEFLTGLSKQGARTIISTASGFVDVWVDATPRPKARACMVLVESSIEESLRGKVGLDAGDSGGKTGGKSGAKPTIESGCRLGEGGLDGGVEGKLPLANLNEASTAEHEVNQNGEIESSAIVRGAAAPAHLVGFWRVRRKVTHGRIRLHIMHSGRFEMEAQSWGSLCDENDVDMKMFGEIDPDDEAAAQLRATGAWEETIVGARLKFSEVSSIGPGLESLPLGETELRHAVGRKLDREMYVRCNFEAKELYMTVGLAEEFKTRVLVFER